MAFCILAFWHSHVHYIYGGFGLLVRYVVYFPNMVLDPRFFSALATGALPDQISRNAAAVVFFPGPCCCFSPTCPPHLPKPQELFPLVSYLLQIDRLVAAASVNAAGFSPRLAGSGRHRRSSLDPAAPCWPSPSLAGSGRPLPDPATSGWIRSASVGCGRLHREVFVP